MNQWAVMLSSAAGTRLVARGSEDECKGTAELLRVLSDDDVEVLPATVAQHYPQATLH